MIEISEGTHAISASLLGCKKSDTGSPAAGVAGGSSASNRYAGKTLSVFNWSDYIDPELISEFEKRTGAKIQYDTYSSDAELETKVLAVQSPYDVIFPSDRSMHVLLKKDLLLKLNKKLLPNLSALDPKLVTPPYDQDAAFSLPYFWGTAAIGIRTDKVKEPHGGFEVLFDTQYSGRITMLDDPENVIALGMLYLGRPMNSVNDNDLLDVKTLLTKQRPLVQAYTSDAYKERLISGDAWIALGWSGDILQARAENENIRAIVPSTGTMMWIDAMAVMRNAPNPELAHEFLNFLMEPSIAARNAMFVKYATPNREAKKLLPAELLSDPAIYPSDEVIQKCEWLQDRGKAIEKIEEAWQEIRK